MTDTRPAPFVSRTAAFIAAGLLIFVGLVFQLGEFIVTQLNVTSYWLIHIIAMNIWNAIVLRLNAIGVEGVLHFWPLLLVGFGLAILLALQPTGRAASEGSGVKRGE
ncbi:MAG TPA: hypothetical protein VEJ45_06660 [Candidatus Acidoferrales bacterium]|nr:hypothetical protein [Candidatus Acidoferrales bacterium]